MTRGVDFIEREERLDRRQIRICRAMLYGAPFLAAALAVSIYVLAVTAGVVKSADFIEHAALVHGLLAALVSAAGALWLPNHPAVRIAHAISAAFLSACTYAMIIAIAANAPWWSSIFPY